MQCYEEKDKSVVLTFKNVEMSMKAITLVATICFAMIFASSVSAEKGPDYDQALKYYDNGNYQESVRIFKEHVKKRPDASAYYRIGYGLYRLGKHSEAKGYFQQAYLIDPTFSPVLAGAPQTYPKKEMRRTPRKSHKRQQSQQKATDTAKEAPAKPKAPAVASISNKGQPPKDQPEASGKEPSVIPLSKIAQPPAEQTKTVQPPISQPKAARSPISQTMQKFMKVLLAAGVLVALFIFIRILKRVFGKQSNSPYVQEAKCLNCGWQGKVSTLVGRCRKCNQPLGDQILQSQRDLTNS